MAVDLEVPFEVLLAFVVARETGASLGAVGMLGIRGGALLGPVSVGVGLAKASLGAVGMLEIRGAVVPGQGGRRLKASILAS